MSGSVERLAIAVLVLWGSIISPSAAVELDEHLGFLQPLIGTDWVGGYVGPDAPDLEISLRFEPILDGRAVAYAREAEAAEFSALTHFYWSPDRGEVLFLSLNNRGMVEEGIAEFEGGGVVLRGESHRTDGSTEFETTLEIVEGGTLRDTFLRRKNGEWVQGHVQEFVAGGERAEVFFR